MGVVVTSCAGFIGPAGGRPLAAPAGTRLLLFTKPVSKMLLSISDEAVFYFSSTLMLSGMRGPTWPAIEAVP